MLLTPPDKRTVTHINPDGNCLFRSFSFLITGSENQHMAVRAMILEHMFRVSHLLLNGHLSNYTSIQEYISHNNMDRDGTWGSDIEVLIMSHLLRTTVFLYNVEHASWCRYCPRHIERTLHDDTTQMSLYIRHPPAHFDIVRSIL